MLPCSYTSTTRTARSTLKRNYTEHYTHYTRAGTTRTGGSLIDPRVCPEGASFVRGGAVMRGQAQRDPWGIATPQPGAAPRLPPRVRGLCHHPPVARWTVEQLEAEAVQRRQVLDAWDRALAGLAEREIRTPCSSPDPEDRGHWTSDDPSDRLIAMQRCGSCEVVTACYDAAVVRREKDHVWGAHDFTSRQGKPKPMLVASTASVA